MSYLDTIKRLEEQLTSETERARVRLAPSPASDTASNREKSELSERSPIPLVGNAESEGELLPLGRKNGRGELVLTLADLPELERRLRLSGWRVQRRGNELICTSSQRVRLQ
jgi:hypothetical protein